MSRVILLLVVLFCPFIGSSQIMSTFAGGSVCGYAGDGGPATAAKLTYPAGAVFDKKGNLYFFEKGNEIIRKVSPSGIISTFAGNGTTGFSGDDGPATNAAMHQPEWVTVDAIGNVYISDFSNYRIRKVDTNGIIHTIAGTGVSAFTGDGGQASAASLVAPSGLCVDDSGNIYECEVARIRKINTSGIISTIAGDGTAGYIGDGGQATASEFDAFFICLDRMNNLYLADEGNYRVRKINAATGIINTVVGNGIPGSSGDGGQATAAEIVPYVVAIDAFGNLFIGDISAKVRKVNVDGIISTFAGTGVEGYSGDGTDASTAEIHNPQGIAFDSCGNVYIADDANCRIRKVTFSHCNYLETEVISTLLPISIYPNPTYNPLQIDNIPTQTNYLLHNIIGATLQQGTLKEGNNTLSLSSLPTGIYLLEMIDDEGNRTVRKIIKE